MMLMSHVRAASHTSQELGYKIVRAQKKVFKGRPNIPPKLCSVVTDPDCSVKSYVTGPSTKCYFNECLFMRVLTHDKIE
jgi:hypothetical protein